MGLLATNGAVARAQDEMERLAQTSGGLREEIAKLPPAQQREKIRQFMQLGIFLNTPEFWQACDDLRVCLKAIDTYGEPLSAPMLEALERNLDVSQQPAWKLRAAALLYRYDRPAGRAYLMNALKSGDVTAATIFALNREETVLPDILRIFAGAKGDDQNDPTFMEALGSWKNPQIERVLLHDFKVALTDKEKGEEQGGDANFVLALAQQGSRSAIPLIWKYYKSLPQETFVQPLVAASLIQLKVPESERLMIALLAQFNAKEKQFARRRILEAIGQTGTGKAKLFLRQTIENYLATKTSPLAFPGERVEQTPPDELAVVAAEQLARLNASDAAELLSRLLLRLDKDKVENSPWPSMRARVARALLNLDETQYRALIRQILGQAWLQNELAARKLKPLPESLMPRRIE